MCDEQQCRVGSALSKTCVVERRDYRLAGAGGRDDEIVVVTVASFYLERVEDRLLVRVGAKLDRARQSHSLCRG